MDLLTLAALCGPWVAPATTVSLIAVESRGHPFAIHDNSAQRSYQPASLQEAEAIAASLLRSGHNLDLGLMQINYRAWFSSVHVPLAQAFQPCLNIAFGTTILSAAFAHESSQGVTPREALTRALSVYNSGSPYHGTRYAQAVLHQGSRAPSPRTPSDRGTRP
jgi:type IV secretion system protein VirB1